MSAPQNISNYPNSWPYIVFFPLFFRQYEGFSLRYAAPYQRSKKKTEKEQTDSLCRDFPSHPAQIRWDGTPSLEWSRIRTCRFERFQQHSSRFSASQGPPKSTSKGLQRHSTDREPDRRHHGFILMNSSLTVWNIESFVLRNLSRPSGLGQESLSSNAAFLIFILILLSTQTSRTESYCILTTHPLSTLFKHEEG